MCIRPGPLKYERAMATELTRGQFQLLKELAAGDARRRSITASISSIDLAYMIKARYITKRVENLGAALYVITALGRQALADATAK